MNQPSVISNFDDLLREMQEDTFNFMQDVHILSSQLLALQPDVQHENCK